MYYLNNNRNEDESTRKAEPRIAGFLEIKAKHNGDGGGGNITKHYFISASAVPLTKVINHNKVEIKKTSPDAVAP